MENKPKIKIIGLSGKAGAGKSWLANRLHQEFSFAPASFAAPLKDDVMNMGFSYNDVYVEKPEHIRRLLQVYGQAKRAQDPNHWVHKGMDTYHKLQRLCPGVVVVFDDVRFMNEVAAIQEAGGIVLRLERIGYESHLSAEARNDVSETELDVGNNMLDGLVEVKDGDLTALRDRAVGLLRLYGVI